MENEINVSEEVVDEVVESFPKQGLVIAGVAGGVMLIGGLAYKFGPKAVTAIKSKFSKKPEFKATIIEDKDK